MGIGYRGIPYRCRAIQGYTVGYRDIQEYTVGYRAIQEYTVEYKSFTGVYCRIQELYCGIL